MLIGIKEVAVTRLLYHMEEEAILLLETQWALVTSTHQTSMEATGNMMLISHHQDAAAMPLYILSQCLGRIGTETQINHKEVTTIVMLTKLEVFGAQNST